MAQPKDQEVLALELQNEAKEKAYANAIDWHSPTFPTWMKANVIISAAAASFSCYGLMMAQSVCFKEFEVTDSIDDSGATRAVTRPDRRTDLCLAFKMAWTATS